MAPTCCVMTKRRRETCRRQFAIPADDVGFGPTEAAVFGPRNQRKTPAITASPQLLRRPRDVTGHGRQFAAQGVHSGESGVSMKAAIGSL